MAAIQPGITMRVDNKLGDDAGEKMSVSLRFNKMEDFSPAAVARQVPSMAKLLEAREQLSNLLRYMDGKVAAEDQLKKLLADPQLMEALKARGRPASDQQSRQNLKPTRSKGQPQPWPNATLNELSAKQVEDARGGRVRLPPQAELQAADRAGRDRSRECGHDPGHARRSRTSRHQGRRSRHDRGDDRADRPEADRADERGYSRAGIPADRERLARTATISSSTRRRTAQAQNPGHERLQERACIAIFGSIPTPSGTRARCSSRSTNTSSASWAASPMAA